MLPREWGVVTTYWVPSPRVWRQEDKYTELTFSLPCPWQSDDGHWTQEKFGSHLALALAPSSPAPPPTMLLAANTSWGKIWPNAHIRSSSPSKATGHTQITQEVPTQGHPFETRQVAVSTNVIETEKDEQMRRQRNLFKMKEEKNPEKTNKIEINNFPLKSSRIINKNTNWTLEKNSWTQFEF